MDCKTCGKPVVPKKGAKRPKLYCNETCRSNHWHRERARAKTKAEEESRNNQFANAARGRDKNGVNNDESKPVVFKKPHKKKPKTVDIELGGAIEFATAGEYNAPSINYLADEPVKWNEIPAPKTLDQLKALCPADLVGLEKSKWIATERQKYGI